MAARGRAAAATVVAVLVLSACSTAVGGRAVRASGAPGGPTSAKITRPPVQARDLLLQTGNDTPFGAATAIPVGDNYFTSASPQNCQAAVVFENSPLRPTGASDHAESAYRFSGPAMYAELVAVGVNYSSWGGTNKARDNRYCKSGAECANNYPLPKK